MPDEDRAELLERLARGTHGGGLGNADKTLTKTPLEYLYEVFATYVEDRRAEPRDDVLTGLATATFPDGTMPEVGDVVRVATNVFSAGQETTVRLLGTALKVIGDRPDIQRKLRDDRSLLPNFIEECLRIESPVKGDFRLSRVPTTVGEEAVGAGCTLMVINGAANRDPRRFEDPDTFDPDRKNARQHLAFGRGIHSCPGAPLARAETRVGLERLLDRTTDIRISEAHHGPAGDRRYQYIPTYILRGLTELHLEFDLAEDDVMKVTVDEDRCRGHGMCLTLCPEVFEMTDDGWAVADPGEVPAGLGSCGQGRDRQLPRASHQRNRLTKPRRSSAQGIHHHHRGRQGSGRYGRVRQARGQGDGRLDAVVVRSEARGARGRVARHPDRRCWSSSRSRRPASGTTPTPIRRQSSLRQAAADCNGVILHGM